ncbi:MAG: Fur family transcriptional regulator [Candidatus Velthaea sp.]
MDSKGVDAGLLQSRYRLTKQRSAILRALADGAHVSAETILERVRAELPGVSLGTIYRTLDILREIGLVQMFAYAGLAARYEASLDKHHHLVCAVCYDITNVPAPDVQSVAQTIAESHRYDDIDASLTITGRCPACAASGRTQNGKA